jgi:formate dehydrogenase subunit gamma
MQLAHLFHVTGAIVTIAGSIGHIYMGLFHVPGSLETMTHGYADTAWMKHHHDLWYEEVKEQARPVSEIPTAHKGGKEIPT